jgi:SAM-dependent methyltransferase
MSNGWELSAQAWIDSMGERGDWGREHVLDPVMLGRVAAGSFERALDVGCGEGRFCRILKAAGVAATGIDPTGPLLELARQRDPSGDYRPGVAEQLEFEPASFDLVVSYLTLIDIVDFRKAIGEMARVLKPGGSLLIANLTGFTSAGAERGWVRDEEGQHLHFPVDHTSMNFHSGSNGREYGSKIGIGRSPRTWRPSLKAACIWRFSRSPDRYPAMQYIRNVFDGCRGSS